MSYVLRVIIEISPEQKNGCQNCKEGIASSYKIQFSERSSRENQDKGLPG